MEIQLLWLHAPIFSVFPRRVAPELPRFRLEEGLSGRCGDCPVFITYDTNLLRICRSRAVVMLFPISVLEDYVRFLVLPSFEFVHLHYGYRFELLQNNGIPRLMPFDGNSRMTSSGLSPTLRSIHTSMSARYSALAFQYQIFRSCGFSSFFSSPRSES